KLAGDRQTVFHVEARTAERTDSRGDVDHVTEFYGFDEISPYIHQWNSNDAKGTGKLVRLDTKGGLQHLPGAPVEHLEEATVEHDTGGIALTPFDRELFTIGKGHHALASRHKTFCVIAAAFSTVMLGRFAVRAATSFSSCFSLGLAIRRPPATT